MFPGVNRIDGFDMKYLYMTCNNSLVQFYSVYQNHLR